MKSMSKSTIFYDIQKAFNDGKSLEFECIHKQTGNIVKFKLEIRPPEIFTDEKGVKWQRC